MDETHTNRHLMLHLSLSPLSSLHFSPSPCLSTLPSALSSSNICHSFCLTLNLPHTCLAVPPLPHPPAPSPWYSSLPSGFGGIELNYEGISQQHDWHHFPVHNRASFSYLAVSRNENKAVHHSFSHPFKLNFSYREVAETSVFFF